MEGEPDKGKQTASKPLYLVGAMLGIVGLLGGLLCFLCIWTAVVISTRGAPSGMNMRALEVLFWIFPCIIVDLILKLVSGGYLAILCILAIKRKAPLTSYKAPVVLSGVNLFLFVMILQWGLSKF